MQLMQLKIHIGRKDSIFQKTMLVKPDRYL